MKIIRQTRVDRIRRRLKRLYGDRAGLLMERFYMMIGRYGVGLKSPRHRRLWSEKDAVLITYADMVRAENEKPLKVLRRFLNTHCSGAFSALHILPFFPWSSDDGFSVIDYREVNPAYGSWEDVEALGEDFSLMFDLVLNHCSAQSEWFRDFVTGIAPARFYFIPLEPETDLAQVTRPRASPLLTKTQTRDGEAWVWTTFSADQADLNWKNPDVLFEFLDILFLYLSKGARILRLDAIAYLWKNIGTNCIHQPECHQVVRLFRDVLEIVAPYTLLLTETNVPHKENISYFGDGNEAHMVYNFTLPPLLLYSLLRGDGSALTAWAGSLAPPKKGCAFLNFTASHDGVGVRPLQSIIPSEEIDWLAEQTRKRGGRVSMKTDPGGLQSPYELNITYFDALGDPDHPELGTARFLCSQAIMLALQGIPAVYFHSLTATPNWEEGVRHTGQNRAINRRKWEKEEIETLLKDKNSVPARIFSACLRMLRRRAKHPAFHPDGAQQVYDIGPEFFCFTRTSPDGEETILCLCNLTASERTIRRFPDIPMLRKAKGLYGVISAKIISGNVNSLTLAPYQAVWLLPIKKQG